MFCVWRVALTSSPDRAIMPPPPPRIKGGSSSTNTEPLTGPSGLLPSGGVEQGSSSAQVPSAASATLASAPLPELGELGANSASVVSSIYQRMRQQASEYRAWTEQVSKISSSLASSLNDWQAHATPGSQPAELPSGTSGSGLPAATSTPCVPSSAGSSAMSGGASFASNPVLQQILALQDVGTLQPAAAMTSAIDAAAAACAAAVASSSAACGGTSSDAAALAARVKQAEVEQQADAQSKTRVEESPVEKLIHLAAQLAGTPDRVRQELLNAIKVLRKRRSFDVPDWVPSVWREDFEAFVSAFAGAVASGLDPEELGTMLKNLIKAIGQR